METPLPSQLGLLSQMSILVWGRTNNDKSDGWARFYIPTLREKTAKDGAPENLREGENAQSSADYFALGRRRMPDAASVERSKAAEERPILTE